MQGLAELVRLGDAFKARRIGHANIFVSNYETCTDFYRDVVGFEEVYRQPNNRASFLSNGNTYHDLALTDVTSKYAAADQKPGLMHVAFELENEVELVAGYERSVAAQVHFTYVFDHDVAHSVYMDDPDGNQVEIYADVVADWRSVRHGTFDTEKPKWSPGSTAPVSESRYPRHPEIRRVPHALFHPRSLSHVALIVERFEDMFDYYTRFIGLSALAGGRSHSYAVLHGSASREDIVLFRQTATGLAPGMHHLGIRLQSETDLDDAAAQIGQRGIAVAQPAAHAARRALTIFDPDALRLQFFVDRDWTPQHLANLSIEEALAIL